MNAASYEKGHHIVGPSVNHQQGGSTMRKVFQKQEGFTLIELMIVVAIIGILAAIAIPNFLQYQMKGRQSEAKTNLQAIRTSEIAFQAERGCYIGAAAEGVVAPIGGTKTLPAAWGLGLGPAAAGTIWCAGAGAVATGNFRDMGFVATGNVNFRYTADAVVAAVVPITPAVSCPLALAVLAAAGPLVQNSFVASAASNLDGDAAVPNAGVSVWNSTNDHGATDCTTGGF
jgi:type IV pilus assembly protein PilA